ncbi:MAG: hypothetical protein KIS92_21995 [Planctomycetota bacterium]|nr:hypothetical protein [Planctomycetota bacterium]
MQDNGPLFALVAFILLSIVFGLMAYLRHQDIEGQDPENPDASTRMSAQILRAKEENLKIQEEILGLQAQIDAKNEELRIQVERGELYATVLEDYTQAYKTRQKWLQAAADFARQAKDLGGRVSEEKGKTEAQIRKDEQESRDRTDAIKRELTEKKDAAISRMAEAKKVFDRDEKNFRVQKNYEQAELDELKRRLDALTQREVERANKSVEIDGKVVRSEPNINLIVIDRGSAAGIKPGYRFEVFNVHSGNKKVHKGYIEVKKVEANISECQIYTKVIELPRDPLSEYIAPEPEYQYSPFQESGKRGSSAQPLSAQPKTVTMGMNAQDPIVEGDFIQNPFYSPSKTYTFYIAGDKTIVRGVQKSAIAYQWPQIERVVKGYGANVAGKVDLGVDFIIAQKLPQDDPEYAKAVSLGIPVMYEWELFRFLDQR